MSWTVSVAPMSAPRITARVCRKLMSPALTKPTSMTDVALLDWMRPVMNAPAPTADNRLLVSDRSSERILLPAAFWRPSFRSLMP